MSAITFTVNGQEQTVDVDETTPLQWVLRNDLQLTGTKYGCGQGECGSCTVQVDGKAVRSCLLPVSDAAGKEIVTVEGLSEDGLSHPLQKAWIEAQTPQCGYCQSGQLMSAKALLDSNPHPTDDEIMDAMSGNLCRCGTYNRILAAVKAAAEANS